ncbi:peptide-methionine (R)-S-oxide reductase MsrB [Maribacter sp.]|uniref:peptide-methionine (R)-S-oxide reductase MsrB n=1 Tax=Maribacter sp. TaxID=1897614 RepID=UPI0025C33B32|nr:peptide-methionine (R)-S-oxide reductase MsrB [Maribacter sp.]
MVKNIYFVLSLLLISCQGISQKTIESNTNKDKDASNYKVNKTDKEWRAELTDMQYYVLRKAGTEIAGSSNLLDNKKEGTYACAACNTHLFKSTYKYDSGSGWPSFDREIKNNVAFDVDYKIGYERIEEHCATCGGHLGHVFKDGPKETTGKRHCVNGAALTFIPKK